MRTLLLTVLAVCPCLLFACRAGAQPLGDRAAAALASGDYDTAIPLYERFAQDNPRSFVPKLNLALAHALKPDAELDLAAANLVAAIELGYTDLERLEREPRLAAFRATETYQRISEAWPEILKARRDAAIQTWKNNLGPRYEYTVDDERRLVVISFPRTARPAQLAKEFRKTELLADRIGVDYSTSDRTPWVVILVLAKPDYVRWVAAENNIQDAADATALALRLPGQYDHDQKRLVSQDADATLRHEYFHVLHHRHQTRLGQRHAPWVLEGLACLAESLDDEGNPLPTERLDIARRRARANRLMSFEDLAGLDFRAFNDEQPLANYAHAYSLWYYLSVKSFISSLYEACVSVPANDPLDDDAMRGFEAWLVTNRPR